MKPHQDEYEIAPGVIYQTKQNQQSLVLTDFQGESISWDFQEIKENPAAWFESLRAVALACRYGPGAAKNQVRLEKLEALLPSGMIMCNVCSSLFGVEPSDFYRFCATLNGKEYCDFQCSQECHETRKKEVYKKELGDAFMSSWSQRFNHQQKTPVDSQNQAGIL